MLALLVTLAALSAFTAGADARDDIDVRDPGAARAGSADPRGAAATEADVEAWAEADAEAGALAAFVDGLVGAGMKDQHLPGVVVSIVQDDGPLFARGWGVADIDAGTAADPRRTLFRIGSISKTMTFTAAMQLAEDGRLDLRTDLRYYLEAVPIEDRFGPLRLWHLMTHTPGFEDLYLGHFFARGVEQDYDPVEYLSRFAPRRVRPPGEMASYSNYGVALAGHVVAGRAGQVFEDYMERQVFGPLGMHDTTFREAFTGGAGHHMSAELAQRRARGYEWADGAFREIGPFHMHRGMAPAGSVYSTAEDMARWMLAHLNGGANDQGRVLRPESTRKMHEVTFRNHPGVAGNAHGFWVNRSHGYSTLEHGGALPGYFANMVLVPELRFGVFVATNGNNGRHFVMSLPERVIGRRFQSRLAIPDSPPPGFDRSAGAYLGDYLINRRGFTTMDKLAVLGNATIRVSADGEGHLYTDDGGEVKRWIALGGDVFASTEDGRTIGFRLGEDGRATHLFGSYGATSAERVSYHRTDRFFLATAALGLAVALLVIVGATLRRLRGAPQNPGMLAAGRLAVGAAAAWAVFLLGFIVHFARMGTTVPDVLFDFPDAATVVLNALALIAVILTGAMLLTLPRVWRAGTWSPGRRLRHTVVLLVFGTLSWQLWAWRAIGFQYL